MSGVVTEFRTTPLGVVVAAADGGGVVTAAAATAADVGVIVAGKEDIASGSISLMTLSVM